MKKKMTYSAKAQEIMKKYEKRLGKNFDNDDKLAKEGITRELNELKNKQEIYKANQQQFQQQRGVPLMDGSGQGIGMGLHTMQMNPNTQSQFINGGNLPKYGGNETRTQQIPPDEEEYDINNPYVKGSQEWDEWNNTEYDYDNFNSYPKGTREKYEQDNKTYINTVNDNNIINNNISKDDKKKKSGVKTVANKNDKYYNPSLGGVSALPLIGSVAGNVITGLGADKHINNVNYDRISPQHIDLGEERNSAERAAQLSRNLLTKNARGLGLNAAATANLGVAAESDISNRLGERIGKSYLQEELSNAQFDERANKANVEIAMREIDANNREKNIAQYKKDQAIQNIIQNTNQYFGDVQKAKRFNEYINAQPGPLKRYDDPDRNKWNDAIFGRTPTYLKDPKLLEDYH